MVENMVHEVNLALLLWNVIIGFCVSKAIKFAFKSIKAIRFWGKSTCFQPKVRSTSRIETIAVCSYQEMESKHIYGNKVSAII